MSSIDPLSAFRNIFNETFYLLMATIDEEQ